MTKSIVSLYDRDGNTLGMPTIHPDLRSGIDAAAKHVGELNADDRKKARAVLEGTNKPPDGVVLVLRSQSGKCAKVHEVREAK